MLILPPLEASHSFTTPSSLTLKKEKSSLAMARVSLTCPQLFIDDFNRSIWFIFAMGERIVLDVCALLLSTLSIGDDSILAPESTLKSHVAKLPSAPALTINGSERLPRSKSDTGAR